MAKIKKEKEANPFVFSPTSKRKRLEDDCTLNLKPPGKRLGLGLNTTTREGTPTPQRKQICEVIDMTDSPADSPSQSPISEKTVDDTRATTTPTDMDETEDTTGLGVLGAGMGEMVELISRLRAIGIEGLGMGLPRIAVVGNQSAGKSSLIEAISGIKVPRYTGTCTRCPLEISLTESNDVDWHCKLSLRFTKKYAPRGDSGSSPWVDQTIEQPLFCELSSKDEVEGVLILAQKAILNPSRDWRHYTPGSRGSEPRPRVEEFEVKFSPNVVCMEITGRDLPNLAFIDLPGVIQTTESAKEDYLIDLVTSLVKQYVCEEDCLVLLAMTMKDDAVNQSAARLARDYGKDRIIGALTKPDTVSAAEFQQWEEILRGKAHTLKHGYFVTKQPSQEQLVKGMSHQEARVEELFFFKNTQPWSTSMADLQHRFGTGALQQYLSQQLAELIRLRLPSIIKAIKEESERVTSELDLYPPPQLDNQLFVITSLLRQFDAEVNASTAGGAFQSKLKHHSEEFRNTMATMRPVIVWMGLEEEERARSRRQPPPGLQRESGRYTLEHIRQLLERTSSSLIPEDVDPRAKEPLIRATIERWEPVVARFLDNVQRLHFKYVEEVRKRIFAPYEKTPLTAKVGELLDQNLQSSYQALQMIVRQLFELEKSSTITTNREEFLQARDKQEKFLLERRQANREEQNSERPPTTPGSGRRGRALCNDLSSGTDPYAAELKIMASVRAYNEVALKRFIDYTVMHVHQQLRASTTDLEKLLVEQLVIKPEYSTANNTARELLVNDPDNEARRNALLRQQAQLNKALAEVHDIFYQT